LQARGYRDVGIGFRVARDDSLEGFRAVNELMRGCRNSDSMGEVSLSAAWRVGVFKFGAPGRQLSAQAHGVQSTVEHTPKDSGMCSLLA